MGYWDTFSHFYSRCFKQFNKACQRLHFFRGPEGAENQLCEELLSGSTETELQTRLGYEYLGFVVLRPTVAFNVGRAALRFDDRPGIDLGTVPEEDPEFRGRPRCKGSSDQIANLMCARLRVRAVPWLQQDVVTGMCATASVWSASQVLADTHDLHKFPYLEITRQAVAAVTDNETLERGLFLHEIRRALQMTGAYPQVFFSSKSNSGTGSAVARMRDILYTFVESHIPVIAVLHTPEGDSAHAVCCVGHLQQDIQDFHHIDRAAKPTVYPFMPSTHYLVSETVPRFYAHDDAYGPYNRLDFLSDEEHERLKSEGRDYSCPVALGRQTQRPYELKALIVPLPPYVKHHRPDAVTFNASVQFASLFKAQTFADMDLQLLWRTVLTKGSTFKQTLIGRRYSPALLRAYASLHLPKYIWLCEFSAFKPTEVGRVLAARDTRPVHGEFLYDTSTPSFDVNPVVMRFGPHFVHWSPEAEPKDETERIKLLEKSRLAGTGYDPVDCFVEPEVSRR